MEQHLFTDDQRAEIKSLLHEALREYFGILGKGAKFWIVTIALIIGSFSVIFGGLKSFLAFIGFTYLK